MIHAFHVFIRKLEIKYAEVFNPVFFAGRLWNDRHISQLDQPPEDYLSCCFIIFPGNLLDGFIMTYLCLCSVTDLFIFFLSDVDVVDNSPDAGYV